jgi:hypothetical protein
MESAMTKPRPHSKDFLAKRESLTEAHLLKHIASTQEGEIGRARAISIGTAFGGTVEISLRRPDGVAIHAILQPVEAIEILHQLAASVGCHLQLRPRDDFASWRDWRTDENGQYKLTDHPPIMPISKEDQNRAIMPPPTAHPAEKGTPSTRRNKNVVAIEKTVDRRNVKSAAKAS